MTFRFLGVRIETDWILIITRLRDLFRCLKAPASANWQIYTTICGSEMWLTWGCVRFKVLTWRNMDYAEAFLSKLSKKFTELLIKEFSFLWVFWKIKLTIFLWTLEWRLSLKNFHLDLHLLSYQNEIFLLKSFFTENFLIRNDLQE